MEKPRRQKCNGKKNPIFLQLSKNRILKRPLFFCQFLKKNIFFFKNLKKSAKHGQISTLSECDGFLLVLKIHIQKFFVLLAQIPCFIQVHMLLKPRKKFGTLTPLNYTKCSKKMLQIRKTCIKSHFLLNTHKQTFVQNKSLSKKAFLKKFQFSTLDGDTAGQNVKN